MRRRYVFSTWLYGRALGVVFFVAFVSLWSQLHALVGSEGIVPAAEQLRRIDAAYGEEAGWLVPTLAWWGASDGALTALAALGTLCAALLALGLVPALALAGCVVTYLSLVNVGGPFTSFQWDVLLIEAGFASLLLVPLAWRHRPREGWEPPALARYVIYFLVAKLMFLSGYVKLASGDPTWADLTALAVHYETQPLPNPLSSWMHHQPLWFHQVTCAVMFVIELAMPVAALLPHRLPRRLAAGSFIALMLVIIATGNYGFFNWLTIAIGLPLLDDAVFRWTPAAPSEVPKPHTVKGLTARLGDAFGVLAVAAGVIAWSLIAPGEHPIRILLALVALGVAGRVAYVAHNRRVRRIRKLDRRRRRRGKPPRSHPVWPAAVPNVRRRAVQSLAVVALLGSFVAFEARLAPEDRTFAREALADVWGMRMFNGYGLFAVMTKRRPEIIIEGSRDRQTWKPYVLPYKPGPLDRAPPVVFGHMPRLDWQMWFAALGGRNRWFMSLLRRIGEGNADVLALFEHDPFPDAPPAYLRARIYDYRFADVGAWWTRGEPRMYTPALRVRR